MTALILDWSLIVAHGLLALAMGCAAVRMIVGPRAQDRVHALDTLYVNGMLLVLTVGIRTGQSLYFEIALIIGVLSFIATAAAAKFLMRGEVIE